MVSIRSAMFDRLDKDGDGQLSKEEFTAPPPRPDSMASRDDREDRPDRPRARHGAEERGRRGPRRGFSQQGGGPPDPQRMLRGMFERFDRNDDGKLAEDEIPGPGREHFDEIDADGDGGVDQGEMRAAMQKMAARFKRQHDGPREHRRARGEDRGDRMDDEADDDDDDDANEDDDDGDDDDGDDDDGDDDDGDDDDGDKMEADDDDSAAARPVAAPPMLLGDLFKAAGRWSGALAQLAAR